MKLSEVKIENIKPGMQIISAIGNPGLVTKVVLEDDNLSKEPHERVRYDTIHMDWNNGKKSTVFHMNADAITLKQ